MQINNLVTTLNEEQFIREKSALAGSSDFITSKMLLIEADKIVIAKDFKYVPSLFKIIDELIVNCYDHFINCIIEKTLQHKLCTNVENKYMTNIIFTICDNGTMSIFNNGYGIPIIKHGNIYLPQKLFSSQRTGTNMHSDENRITGGTNGIGATIVTAFSKSLLIEIIDEAHIYKQTMCKNEYYESVFAEPIITKNTGKVQCTKITFDIDWEQTKYKKFTKAVKADFIAYIYKRLYQIKLLADHKSQITNLPAVKIVLKHTNTNHIIAPNINANYTLAIKPNFNADYPSELKISINVTNESNNYSEMSVINGIEVIKNPFLEHLKTQLFKSIINYCYAKNLAVTIPMLKNYFAIIMLGSIPNPQWVGQTKESFKVESNLFAKYNLSEQIDAIKAKIGALIYEIIASVDLKKKNKINKVDLAKYVSCENHLRKKYGANHLFLPEGDSASSFITSLLKYGVEYTAKNSGKLTLSGVIFNTFHKINRHYASDFKIIKVNEGSKLLYKQKAADNKFICEFRTVTKLDDCNTYDNIEDINKLPYNTIICATDPDLDGYNIGGLLIVLIAKWPGLIKNRRLKLLHLPICRIIPKDINKNKSKYMAGNFQYWEFFMQSELENWLVSNKIPNTHMVKYYKGLATIDEAFFPIIARNIDKYLFTIVYDKDADKNLELYYGKYRIEGDKKINLANERKKVLCTPVREMTKIEAEWYYRHNSKQQQKGITITMFLEIFVKSYQIDNVNRKLLKLMDGQNNVTGKLLHSFTTVFGANNKELLVSNIAAKSKEETSYHHGESSIENAVISCGQTIPGKRLMPLLTACGSWGSRSDGGKKTCGAPRYINALLNEKIMRKLFIKDDNIIIPQQYEEGQLIEPYFYLPIIPLIVLDNYVTTGHGWKIEIWGRDYNDVMQLINHLLKLELGQESNYDTAKILRINKRLTKGKIDYFKYAIKDANDFYDSTESTDDSIEHTKLFMYSSGIYELLSDYYGFETIHITELPIGKWTDVYLENLRNKIGCKKEQKELFNIVEQIRNNSDDKNIDIKIMLKKGWREHLKIDRESINNEADYDDIILKFGLRIRLNDELNIILPKIILEPGNYYKNEITSERLIICNGGVKMYKSFTELIIDWFHYRKYYYERRIARSKEILKLKLLKQENILNYMQNYSKLKLRGKSSKEFEQILECSNFIKFCSNYDYTNICDSQIIMLASINGCYSYLKKIPSGNMTEEHIMRKIELIASIKSKLLLLDEPNIAINTWIAEIAKI